MIRTIFGVIVALATFFAVAFVVDVAADAMGMPTYIDFGKTVTVTHGSGRYSYETEEDGASTYLGEAGNILALVLGLIAGRVTAVGWVRAMAPETKALASAAVAGLLVYGVVGALVLLVFGEHPRGFMEVLGIIMGFVAFGLGALAAYGTYQRVKARGRGVT